MSREYLLSIITVVKNAETTIERCIKSVLNQNYKNIQYIIIEGNSSDKTKQILICLNGKIEVLCDSGDKKQKYVVLFSVSCILIVFDLSLSKFQDDVV